MLSVMMRVLRVSISLFCGYPKSMISVGESNKYSFNTNCRRKRNERHTVDEFVNQYEVVLNGLLIHFPKV